MPPRAKVEDRHLNYILSTVSIVYYVSKTRGLTFDSLVLDEYSLFF